MAWREYFIYGVNISLQAGNGTVFTRASIRIDSDADFEFQKTTYQANSGNIRIRYQDDSTGRYLTKISSDLRLIGSNFIGTPFIWSRPYVILAGTTLTVEAADASGKANLLRLVFHGGKIRPGNPPWERRFRALMPFVYNDSVSISANGTAPLRIEIDNDAHFLVQKLTGFKHKDCTISIREGSRDRDWQNQAIYFDCVFGNGQFPNVLYANRFIYRGSVITMDVNDISGQDNYVEVNLIGVKLYE